MCLITVVMGLLLTRIKIHTLIKRSKTLMDGANHFCLVGAWCKTCTYQKEAVNVLTDCVDHLFIVGPSS